MIKRKISAFKSRLTTIGNEEPLNKLSLTTIILLDLFILMILFSGLDDHTKQLTSPSEYMPQIARQAFLDQTWSKSVRISKLQSLVLSDHRNYSYRHNSIFETENLERMHPLCRDFYEKTKQLSLDKTLQHLFIERKQNADELQKITAGMDKSKKAYDTHLLETIAEKNTPDNKVNSIANRSKRLTAQAENLTLKITHAEQQINAHPGVQEIWAMVSPGNQDRQQLIRDFNRFERWYPLKELAWQLLFILPIFCIFYAWSSRSVKKSNNIQTLISSHLVVIASLPIILKLIELALDLIPNYFFKNLFKILKSLHLIAIWHYLVIFGAIGIGLFLVYFIQRKVFNRQKVIQKRLMKGACVHCNKKLPANVAVCPFCGTQQFETCTCCQKKTPIGGIYCIYCGTNRSHHK